MADRYWVGGAGTWTIPAFSAGNHWATSSGGAGSNANAPVDGDNVFFDASSGGGSVSVQFDKNCNNLIMTGFTGTLAFGTGGNSRNNSFVITGNLTIGAAMTLSGTNFTWRFNGTSGTQVLTTNGKTITSSIEINCPGATFQLADNFTSSAPVTDNRYLNDLGNRQDVDWPFIKTAGTFDANGKNVTFTGQNAGPMGSFTGGESFVNLTITGTANAYDVWELRGDVTVSGTLTVNGNSVTNRKMIKSNAIGTNRTITAATVTMTNVDLQNITGAGAGSWDLSAITGLSGDAGGNSGITFTAAQDHYWVGNAGNWNSTTKWSTSTGGASGARVPLPQDKVIFDANSITSASQTMTANMPRLGGEWVFTNVANTPTIQLTLSSFPMNMYGPMALNANMAFTTSGGPEYLGINSPTSFSLNTQALSMPTIAILMNGATLTNSSDYSGSIYFYAGTWTTANYAISTGFISIGSASTKTVNWGSSTITMSSGGSGFQSFTRADCSNLTSNAGTSNLTVGTGSAGCSFKSFVSISMYDVIFKTSSGAWSDNRFFCGILSCHNLTITGGFTGTTPATDFAYLSGSGQGTTSILTTFTVSGTFTATGTSAACPLVLQAIRPDVNATYHINAAAVSLTDVVFSHMKLGGAATWSGTRIGDAGGNTGLSADAPRTLYWIGDGGNFHSNTHWATTSGGSSASTYPLPQDLCIFDANSFTVGAQTVEMNMYLTPSLRMTGVSNSPILAFNSAAGIADSSGYSTWVGNEYTFNTGFTWSTSWGGLYISEAVGGTMSCTFNGRFFPDVNSGYWEIGSDANYNGDANHGTIKFNDDITGTADYVYGDGGTSIWVAVGATWDANEIDLSYDSQNVNPVFQMTHKIHGTVRLNGGSAYWRDYGASAVDASSYSRYEATTTGKILIDGSLCTDAEIRYISNSTSDVMNTPIYMQDNTAFTVTLYTTNATIDQVEKKPGSTGAKLLINTLGARVNRLIYDGTRAAHATLFDTAGGTLTLVAQDREVSYANISNMVVSGGLRAANCTNGGGNTGITFETMKQQTQ